MTRPAPRAPPATVATPAAEIGGVDEGRAGRIELAHKGVGRVSRWSRLEGSWRRGKIGREGGPRYIRVARPVHGDPRATVVVTAAEISGVDEGRAGRIELAHKGVVRATPPGRLDGPWR